MINILNLQILIMTWRFVCTLHTFSKSNRWSLKQLFIYPSTKRKLSQVSTLNGIICCLLRVKFSQKQALFLFGEKLSRYYAFSFVRFSSPLSMESQMVQNSARNKIGFTLNKFDIKVKTFRIKLKITSSLSRKLPFKGKRHLSQAQEITYVTFKKNLSQFHASFHINPKYSLSRFNNLTQL